MSNGQCVDALPAVSPQQPQPLYSMQPCMPDDASGLMPVNMPAMNTATPDMDVDTDLDFLNDIISKDVDDTVCIPLAARDLLFNYIYALMFLFIIDGR